MYSKIVTAVIAATDCIVAQVFHFFVAVAWLQYYLGLVSGELKAQHDTALKMDDDWL